MKLVVKLHGFKEGERELRAMGAQFRPIVVRELAAFGKEAVGELQRAIRENAYGLPPKRRRDGNPPLIDSEKYVNSYQAESKDMRLTIGATGMNDHMSNEALGELLEHGDGYTPAKPHLRPWNLWVENKLPALGERIARRVLRGR